MAWGVPLTARDFDQSYHAVRRPSLVIGEHMSSPVGNSQKADAPSVARHCLKTIFVLGLAGSAFSGTLTYRDLAGAGASCPAVGSSIAGVPVCVYGFLMFLFVTAVAAWGLVGGSVARPKRIAPHAP